MAVNRKSYYTSSDLIESVKRSISFPASQNTFSDTDLLSFANEEMLIDQVPAVLSYHEEYYVFSQTLPLTTQQSRYPLPPRAVGMKLRDVAYKDVNGNLFEMSRINATDKAFFQRTTSSNAGIHKFYLEGNDVVLTPQVQFNPTGSIVYYYYIRPNQLVDNTRAAISSFLNKTIIPTNKSCMPADITVGSPGSISITSHGFTTNQAVQVSSTLNIPAGLALNTNYYIIVVDANTIRLSATFGGSAIPITSIGTGIHTFVRALSQTNTFTATNIDLSNNTISIVNHSYLDNDQIMFSSQYRLPNELSNTRIYYVVSASQNTFKVSLTSGGSEINLQSIGSGTHTVTSDLTNIVCTTVIPDNIINTSTVDFLQTEGGHVILGIDQKLADNAISGNTITVRTSEIPTGFIVGDYICLAKEAIIPFLPSDLHYGLAERTCARILTAINDKEGLALSAGKMARIEKSESHLLNNRVEGSPEKILARHSVLRYSRIGHRRRF